MIENKKNSGGKKRNREAGLTLVSVLILVFLAGVMVPPLLSYVSTSVIAQQKRTGSSAEFYAADAGVEDALWQVKYDHLDDTFTSPVYDPYRYFGYDGTEWTYNLTRPVNNENVSVSLSNVWVPKDIDAPDAAEAKNIIDAQRLVVTGSNVGTNSYEIDIAYNPRSQDEENNLRVQTIGVWLLPGFTFDAGSSNLESDSNAKYYSSPVTEDYYGNEAVIWNFSSTKFVDLPGTDKSESTRVATITFDYTPNKEGGTFCAVAWIKTAGVSDIPYAWDADQKVYRIDSTAGDTTVTSYTIKSEVRKMGSAIMGDYRATGNSLMKDTNHDQYGIREQVLSESSSTVNDIPADAQVAAAYLYWSAWRKDASMQTLFLASGAPDPCSNFQGWSVVNNGSGSVWSVNSSQYFQGHYSSGKDRYLTLKNPLNLNNIPATSAVAVEWKQWVSGTLHSGDELDYQIATVGPAWSDSFVAFKYGDTVATSRPQSANFLFTIPRQYLTADFQVRFYLNGFSGSNEYCCIDDIAVVKMDADASVKFAIDGSQVYFDSDGNPKKGTTELTTDTAQILPNFNDETVHGYSYACFKDVTDLVKTFSRKAPDPATNYPGNGNYTVGNVAGDPSDQWSYAAWSLVIIYSSPETKGHQLYLYDKFLYAGHDSDIDFDGDGKPGGTISGFIVPAKVEGEVDAAKLTVFVGEGDECFAGDYLKFNGAALSNSVSPANNVWNSKSPDISGNIDGIDIDTFDVTWDSGLLKKGDTSATLDLPTQTDVFNVAYIIISFRSETKTGGILSYLISRHG